MAVGNVRNEPAFYWEFSNFSEGSAVRVVQMEGMLELNNAIKEAVLSEGVLEVKELCREGAFMFLALFHFSSP